MLSYIQCSSSILGIVISHTHTYHVLGTLYVHKYISSSVGVAGSHFTGCLKYNAVFLSSWNCHLPHTHISPTGSTLEHLANSTYISSSVGVAGSHLTGCLKYNAALLEVSSPTHIRTMYWERLANSTYINTFSPLWVLPALISLVVLNTMQFFGVVIFHFHTYHVQGTRVVLLSFFSVLFFL